MSVKTAAAAAVAQLFRDSRAMGVLQGHPTLLQALARLLREDAKKSEELCISLLMVFFALSHLPSAHALLVQVGGMEWGGVEGRLAFQQGTGVSLFLGGWDLKRRVRHWQQAPHWDSRLSPAAMCDTLCSCGAPASPPVSCSVWQNQVGSLTMDLLDLELRRAEHWQQREGVAVADVGAKLLSGEPLAPGEARLAGALARQEPLLYVGLSLLLNMAEGDVSVEAKMVKKVGQGPQGGAGDGTSDAVGGYVARFSGAGVGYGGQ